MIDLRSDTVTKPDRAMLQAMMAAEVGDDVLGDDPAVKELEAEVADLLGFPAALFVTSGTMANQLALHMHCRPGESVICEKDSHIVLYESGGAAALSGLQCDLLAWEDHFSNNAIDQAWHGDDIHAATTRLVAVENTHNRKGGACLDLPELARIQQHATSRGLKLHCDGARLWNAAVALGRTEKSLAQGFDSVAVCFSKGLGAPVGSALCGSRDLIKGARVVRKRWGGGMRQVGYIAAAALHGLRHNRERIADDHRRIETLAKAISDLNALIKYPDPATNMLYFRLPNWQGDELAQALKKRGILMLHLGQNWLRAVGHLMISDSDIDSTIEALRHLAKAPRQVL